jgi:hypothetical protein
MLGLMMLYTIHCVGVSADMYSAPSIVLQVGLEAECMRPCCAPVPCCLLLSLAYKLFRKSLP